LAGGPDPARQADVLVEGPSPGGGLEVRAGNRRLSPGAVTTEYTGRSIDQPKGPDLPAEALADRLEDVRAGVTDALGLGQHFRGRQPGCPPLLLAPALSPRLPVVGEVLHDNDGPTQDARLITMEVDVDQH